jgi:hypothetical protein
VTAFANKVENAMDQAEKQLPKTAKDSAHARARQRVLDEYLGIEAVQKTERFRAPIAKG